MKIKIYPEAFIKLSIESLLNIKIQSKLLSIISNKDILENFYIKLLLLSDFVYLSQSNVTKNMNNEKFSKTFFYALNLCLETEEYDYTFDFFEKEFIDFFNYLENNNRSNDLPYLLYEYINKKITTTLNLSQIDNIKTISIIASETKSYIKIVDILLEDLLNTYKIDYK